MMVSKSNRFFSLLTVFALLAITGTSAVADTRVPLPQLAPALGEQCVEDTDFMRRNHMDLLKHQRDETVHRGIRTRRYSLKNCLDCHAPKATTATAATEKHFCQSCHEYAGVRLDCFQCHARFGEPSESKQ
ncbi:MAG: sulfate reduction electron transfer complex DsrMKJOP subunit DsrJ [Gammaproteobacteria bacterium]